MALYKGGAEQGGGLVAHDLGGIFHTADSLTDLNSKINNLIATYGGLRDIGIGTAAQRPAASSANRFWYATDTNVLSEDTGSSWFDVTIANDTVTNAKLANMATATIKGRTTAGAGDPEDLTAAQAGLIINKVRQVQMKTLSAKIGGATTIPVDDTIPQITEGVAFITSDAFVPVAADSVIAIECFACVSSDNTSGMTWALFKNSDANAIDTGYFVNVSGRGYAQALNLVSKQTAGSTASRTYQLRIGSSTYATYNFEPTTDDYGGVAQLTIMKITEIAP